MSLVDTTSASTSASTPQDDSAASPVTSTPAVLSAQLVTQQSFHTSLMARHPSLHIPPIHLYLLSLHTTLRCHTTTPQHFAPLLHTLIGALLDHTLSLLPYQPATPTTPTGQPFDGCAIAGPVMCVSVMRAGEAFEPPVRTRLQSVIVGKLLIQRDESSPTKAATCYYSKLPATSSAVTVLLCDVMLATGNSLCVAIEHLLSAGYELSQIIALTLIGCPEGVEAVTARFPGVRLCCQWVDRGLNEHKYILPGVGDAGDRYFNTVTH